MTVDDDAIRELVTRLGRAHPSGGIVIERAAIMAEGADADAVMTWIGARGGKPDAPVAAAPSRGLHGAHFESAGGAEWRTPSRFVLRAGALD